MVDADPERAQSVVPMPQHPFGLFAAQHGNNSYVLPFSVGLNSVGNPNLKPETSRSFTGGVVLEPVRWLSLTVDYYNIRKKNVIYQTAATQYGHDYLAGLPLPAGITITPNGPDPVTRLIDDLATRLWIAGRRNPAFAQEFGIGDPPTDFADQIRQQIFSLQIPPAVEALCARSLPGGPEALAHVAYLGATIAGRQVKAQQIPAERGVEFTDAVKSPKSLDGRNTQMLHVHVDTDIDAHFARARDAGATILMAPSDQFYGDRTYRCADPEGHIWEFAQTVKVLSLNEMEKASGGLKMRETL